MFSHLVNQSYFLGNGVAKLRKWKWKRKRNISSMKNKISKKIINGGTFYSFLTSVPHN